MFSPWRAPLVRWICGTVVCLFTACSQGGGGTDAGVNCDGLPVLTTEQVFSQHLSLSNATTCVASGCHGGTAGGLTFKTAADLYTATVNVASRSDPSLLLVKPRSPGESQLYRKLLASAPTRMPSGGPYFDDLGLRDIAGWICAGPTVPNTTAVPVTLSGMSPSSGYVGTAVTLTGTGFSTTLSANTVRFNGTQASMVSVSATSAVVRVPAGATSGPVTVTVGGQSASSSGSFTVLVGNPVPFISALSPCGKVAGAAGFNLGVTGEGFVPGAAVSFRGSPVTTTLQSATQLTATIPGSALVTATADNVIPVTVTNPGPGGGVSLPWDFGIATQAVSFEADVQSLFTANCTGAGCHGGSQSPTLLAGQSRSQLVDVPSEGCPSTLRVRACSASRAQSFLIDKILSSPSSPPCSGTPMPKGQKLTAAERQRIVDWVAAGALP
jgi:hypothetical protein